MKFEIALNPLDCVSAVNVEENAERVLPEEHQLTIFVNEIETYRVICTPTLLPELVLGRLKTEGVISSVDEVETLSICQQGLRARVFLTHPVRLEASPEQVPTCCTGNRTFAGLDQTENAPKTLSPIAFSPVWIDQWAQCLNTQMPLYAETRSTHGAFLIQGGELLVSAEDLGRHNALDKVVGWAMKRGVELEQCLLFTTGRVPVDMTIKAIRAGVPVLCSKARPTKQAVELARKFGLTLLGEAKGHGFITYTAGGKTHETDSD